MLINDTNWKATKEAMTRGLSGNRKHVMDVVLENTRGMYHVASRSALYETATAGATAAGNIASVNRVILPLIRRVMPTVIANDLVGVQPMTGPVGQINTLRVRYADTFGSPTPVTSGTEALSPFQIAAWYSGNGDSTNPAAAQTAVLEGTLGRRLSVQIVKQTVTAQKRVLNARWTIDAAQDAQAQHGIDLEAEIMAFLAQEMVAEIDQEILNSLRALPGAPATTYDQATVSGTATYVGEEHAALALLMLEQANRIARRTHRQAGNWAVLSHIALTVLQSGSTSMFARTTEGQFAAPSNSKFVGMLNGAMRIYVDGWAQDDTPVLVGYKGATENDAAAFYCPYIPLTSTGTMLDPSTGEPQVIFTTRYGWSEMTNTASSLGNSADYLGLIAINAANIRFQ